MARIHALGDFEQLVVLAILRLEAKAFAPDIRRAIETAANRPVSRGALYATLDRLEAKGLLAWRPEPGSSVRAGIPRRRFWVTAAGLRAVKRSYRAVATLARGLEGRLGSAS